MDGRIGEKRMIHNWTELGRKYTDTRAKRDAVLAEVASFEWHDFILGGVEAPMMQGLALQEIINHPKFGRPLAVSWNGVLQNRYSLLGVRHKFKDCMVNSFWLDTGTEVTCLLTERLEDGQG
jgi:hypothetical protein